MMSTKHEILHHHKQQQIESETHRRRIRDYGIVVGSIPTGKLNSITDVSGVRVGHCTLSDNQRGIQTGVTAILPHEGNIFREKVMAGISVINGFGKTLGSIQLEELGCIETPIILTNTLSVGTATDALIQYMLKHNNDIGVSTGSVNPLVCECNDSYLNDMRGCHVQREHVLEAIQKAAEGSSTPPAEGAVGAGTGMSAFQLKGGIGTASRQFSLRGTSTGKATTATTCPGKEVYTLGALVLSNYGKMEDFTLNGLQCGRLIAQLLQQRKKRAQRQQKQQQQQQQQQQEQEQERDEEQQKGDEEEEAQQTVVDKKGSIIIILATDLPLTERQLKRISKRASTGLIRTGSFMGHGSGDIVVAFTTANRILHYETRSVVPIGMTNENDLDIVFRAVAEATEEAILNSMICAETTTGRDGHVRYSLREFIDEVLARK